MLENIYNNFKKLDFLYKSRDDIILINLHSKNHKLLKKVIGDIFKLRDFIKTHSLAQEDIIKIQNILITEIYNFTNFNEIECKFDILNILKYSYVNNLLFEFIKKTFLDIKDLEIYEKMSVLCKLKSLCKNDQLILEVDNLIKESYQIFVKSVELNPKKLDKFLCNLIDVILLFTNQQIVIRKEAIKEYKKHEILYFTLSLNILSKKNLAEDLSFLIERISKRSSLVSCQFSEEIKNIILVNKLNLGEVEKKRIFSLLQ